MDTLKELLSSIRDWFSDRIGNPLFASFLIAWLILNWRVVLVLFSDMEPLEKISWLDTKLYPSWWHWSYYGLIAPLTTSVVYVGVAPYVLRKISVYWRTQQHKSTRAMLEADQIQPVSPEVAQRLIRERINARLSLKQEQARFGDLEADYLDQIEKLQEQLKTSHLQDHPSIDDIDIPAESVTKFIAESLPFRSITLLDAACTSDEGGILVAHELNGTQIFAGGKTMIPNGAPKREVANWLGALKELELKQLIKPNDINEVEYTVTQLGYDAHDVLIGSVFDDALKDVPNGVRS